MAAPMKREAKPNANRKTPPSAMHKERFPGEGRAYRTARNTLLAARAAALRVLGARNDPAPRRRIIPLGRRNSDAARAP